MKLFWYCIRITTSYCLLIMFVYFRSWNVGLSSAYKFIFMKQKKCIILLIFCFRLFFSLFQIKKKYFLINVLQFWSADSYIFYLFVWFFLFSKRCMIFHIHLLLLYGIVHLLHSTATTQKYINDMCFCVPGCLCFVCGAIYTG